jgi:hypothetical protein
VASFKEIMDDTGFNDVALVDKFEKGLSKSLWKTIGSVEDVPTTLKGWMDAALKFDRQQRVLDQRSKLLTPFGSSNSRHNHPTSHPPHSTSAPPRQTSLPKLPSSSEVVPMEVDASRKRSNPSVCFKCRKPGHFARDCKSKFDINALDYDSLRAHFQKEFEDAKAKDNAQDFQ